MAKMPYGAPYHLIGNDFCFKMASLHASCRTGAIMTAPLTPTLDLAFDLIRRPSVTPVDEGCQELMMRRLAACGFEVEHMRIEEVENFWAKRGGDGPVLCFAGHTDVVPTGPLDAWQYQPFDVRVDEDGMLCGRGAADMKGSLASMIIAVERFVADYPKHKGAISFLITSDEEGPARHQSRGRAPARAQRAPGLVHRRRTVEHHPAR